jgi:uncharacterized protein (DUF58 family)
VFVTGRLSLLVALGVIPVVLLSAVAAISPWLMAAGWVAACLLLLSVDVALAASTGSILIERELPARALRDAPVEAFLLVANRGRRRLRGLLRDGWQPTAGAGTARAVVDVPPGERRRFPMPLHPRRRGELRTAFVAVRSSGPLGLAGRQGRIDVPGALRVLPPFTARRHLPSRLARLRELDGNTSLQVRGQGTEFDSLREYVRGDDVRSIDWRATARAGTTMLRTWRPERDRHVVIVIDTGRTAAARVGDGVRLDAAMESALLLGALATRAGDHVHLVMFDRVVRARVTGYDGPALLPAMVDAMAPVDAQLIDTDWEAAMAQVRSLTTRASLVVLLTAQDAVDSARGFLAALPALTARTRVLVGTATDAHSRTADSARTAETVYLEAATERAARDAEAVAEAVRRAGGEVSTASADDLPPLIADRYLALKAAGRL